MPAKASPTLRVLGIDPGTRITGCGVVESDGRRHRLIEFWAITSPANRSFAERLDIIGRKLEESIDRLAPDACAIEESFYALNASSALKLGQVRGALLITAARAGLPVFEYSPLEIKSAVVGYGRAEKTQVQEMVRRILGLKESPSPLDASDALAVAICHVHNFATQSRIDAASPGASPRTARRRRG
jgi:crossover junction endodeoxyribonuclease RuvC